MSTPLQLLVVLILLSSFTFTPCHAQQQLIVTPNTTVNLSVHSDEPPHILTWTLTTPDISITVQNISFVPPLHPFLTLGPLPSTSVEPSTPATITVTVNSSIVQPAAYNTSLLVVYGPLYQQLLVNFTLTCLQAIQFTRNLSAPYQLTVGQPFLTTIKLRSQPYSGVNISFAINQQSGDYSGTTSTGVAWRGGGPLLTSNVTWLYFDTSNWNTTQACTIASSSTPLIYGDRWSTLNYSYSTADATLLQPLNATFSSTPLNITIVESNVASVHYANDSFTLYKNAQSSIPLLLSLTCQPRAPVNLTFTPTPWSAITPTTLTFTPSNWNVTVAATMELVADYTIGWENVTMDFPLLASDDDDFAVVSGGRIELTLLDADPSFEWFYPIFGPVGTNLTLTWPANLTFTPQSPGYAMAVVECVFGASQYACNTSASGYCPVAVPATIINTQQVMCTVPECGYDAAEERTCYSPASVSVLINGLPASLSANTTANLYSACQPINSCKVAPTVTFTGNTPVPAECLGAGCDMWPAVFSYLPVPVITSVSPLTSELSTSNPITVVLTVVGAAPFSSSTALCMVDGQPSPSYATFATNTTTVGSQQSVVLTCLTPIRDDLLGSTSSTPLSFQVTLTCQLNDLSLATFVLAGVDSVTVKQSKDVTIFIVCCFLAFGSLFGLVFQHYCCRDCRTINHQLTGEGKQRGERGPQMLIDYLEPRVRLKARLVEEEERLRRMDEREERLRVEERVRKLRGEKRAEEEKKRAETERVRAAMADKEQKRNEAHSVTTRGRSPSAIAVDSTVRKVGGLTRARLMLGMMKAAIPATSETPSAAEGSGSPPPPPPARHARSGSVIASVLGRMRGSTTTNHQQQPQIVISQEQSSTPLLESKEEVKEDMKRRRSLSKQHVPQHRYLAVESEEERKERKSKKGHRSRSASPRASPKSSERTLKPPNRGRRPSNSESRKLSPSPNQRTRGLQR